MKRTIITVLVVTVLMALITQVSLAAFSTSTTQTITQEIVAEPARVRDPDQFDVFVRFGWDCTRYCSRNSNTLRGSIEAAGEYNGIQYMLYIPAGCVIEGTEERVSWLWLDSIKDNVLSFVGKDATFSEPCTLYIAEGGRLYQDYWTRKWFGGTWAEVGTFTSIIDGEAHLE